jgi:hypothetical protein
MSERELSPRALRRIRPEHRRDVEALVGRIARRVERLIAEEAARDPRFAAAREGPSSG